MAARLVMQHKPYSFLSPSTKWQGNKRFAADLLTRANQRGGERVELRELRALECMGRLDADSTGLMLWSNDPVLADRVKHPSSRVEKEYLVRVRGHETWSDLERGSAIDALRSGMILDGRRHLPAMAGWLNEAQLRVVLVEGKHRQIRKMCEALGLEVSGLKRVRVGCIRLGGLPTGCWTSVPASLRRNLEAEVGLVLPSPRSASARRLSDGNVPPALRHRRK